VKILPNEAFGYLRVTIERPLRLRWEITPHTPALVEQTKFWVRLNPADQKHLSARLAALAGVCTTERSIIAAKLGDVPKLIERALWDALAVRDPEAPSVTNRKGNREPDPDLRGVENVPLPQVSMPWEPDPAHRLTTTESSQAIEKFLTADVVPYVPDAWIDHARTKIGYEIPLTRYFYKYVQPRSPAVVDAELIALEAEIQRLLRVVEQRRQSTLSGVSSRRIVYGTDGRPIGIDGCRCVRLGGVAVIQSGLTMDERRDNGADPVTLPYLRVANVQDGSLVLDELKEVTVPRALAERCSLRSGDVLMTEGGDPDKLGRGTVWPGDIDPCLHQNHVFAVRPDARLLPEYLALVTRTPYARAYFEMTASKTTGIASTSTTKIASFRVPLPSVMDQRRIIRRTQEALSEIDELRNLVAQQLSLLQEHHRAVIAGAVSVQLDEHG
jgi:hypothetical protein